MIKAALILLLLSVIPVSAKESNVCTEIRAAMAATIKAGASTMVISKGADDLYDIVSTGGKGESCKNLRWAFRTMKRPYNGDKVSPKEWVEAIKLMMTPDKP